MNVLAKIPSSQTMTSREIAELTGKQHKDVLRDIRTIIKQLTEAGEDASGFVEKTEKDKANRGKRIFALTYSATMTLVSGYNVVLRSKIVNRWQALEAKQPKPKELTYDEIMQQALSMADSRVKALTSQVAEIQPKAEALDRIATAEGSMNTTNAAKHLQVRPKVLFDVLSAKKWIYRRVGCKSWIGYQDKVQQGLVEHKVTTKIIEGVEKIREQVRITSKGIAKLAGLIDLEFMI